MTLTEINNREKFSQNVKEAYKEVLGDTPKVTVGKKTGYSFASGAEYPYQVEFKKTNNSKVNVYLEKSSNFEGLTGHLIGYPSYAISPEEVVNNLEREIRWFYDKRITALKLPYKTQLDISDNDYNNLVTNMTILKSSDEAFIQFLENNIKSKKIELSIYHTPSESENLDLNKIAKTMPVGTTVNLDAYTIVFGRMLMEDEQFRVSKSHTLEVDHKIGLD